MADAKKKSVPKGSFVLRFVAATGACPRCFGLSTLRVEDSTGTIGYVTAEWPWDSDIPEDPAQHPAEPHYRVEWFAQDAERRDILGVAAGDPHFIARAIYDARNAGLVL